MAVGLLFVAAIPPAAQDGPWNHRVLLARSPDGLNWELLAEPVIDRASVPELFLDPEGRPTLLFVDSSGPTEALGAMQQDASGGWVRKQTNLRGADPNVVALEDGTYRAYVKQGLDGTIAAYSSTDGLNWSPLGVVFRDARYPNATDSDVFRTAE